MKVQKVVIELVQVNPIDRRMMFHITDEEGRIFRYAERLWESDSIDVLRTIFRSALRCFHEEFDPEKGKDNKI